MKKLSNWTKSLESRSNATLTAYDIVLDVHQWPVHSVHRDTLDIHTRVTHYRCENTHQPWRRPHRSFTTLSRARKASLRLLLIQSHDRRTGGKHHNNTSTPHLLSPQSFIDPVSNTLLVTLVDEITIIPPRNARTATNTFPCYASPIASIAPVCSYFSQSQRHHLRIK